MAREGDDRGYSYRQGVQQLGAHALAEPSRMTTKEWLDLWWELESDGWSPSTQRTQSSVLDKWVEPYIGEVKLRDLGTARLRTWRADITNNKCSAHQANKALRVLSASLGVAVRDGLLPSNPCVGLRRLPTAVTRPRAMAPMEVELVRARMPTLRDVVMLGLMAYAGLRPGEVLALTWADVGNVLIVDRSVSDGEIRQTKTNRRRTVEVVEPLAEDLALHRPKKADPKALVCAGRKGQVLNLNNWRRRVWDEACEDATPYDGRHTYASLLLHEGRSLPYVSAAMGHGSATTTLRHYAHVIDETRIGTAVPMVDAIKSARAELEAGGVYQMCTQRPVRTLRSPARRAKDRS